ncbi:invasion associated locus B family protein [Fulvimarina sp. 2208YS6-2-32]|uniref:Invasion associated locus B family protein n=1 Tax=Fulvimarina uroteuthidis TaxID=3098149 RepID=A0ABU5HZI1_9HYPH|nr:invasion associated locus B family protein [Fulvimarina sp. 2208YS6-2-32]MDY8108538.1 invasion associated locus B family protein [Fulvimarina sp. 2208YS6-2-32]
MPRHIEDPMLRSFNAPGRAVSRFSFAILPLVATVFLFGAAAGANAQFASEPIGRLKSQHGAWGIVCSTPAGAPGEQCMMRQIVLPPDRREIGFAVSILKLADGTGTILRARAPLGIILPNGLRLHLDGEFVGITPFLRCFETGCVADVAMDEDLISKLSKGREATFSFFQTPEQGIGIPVSLEGFTEAFKNLPQPEAPPAATGQTDDETGTDTNAQSGAGTAN